MPTAYGNHTNYDYCKHNPLSFPQDLAFPCRGRFPRRCLLFCQFILPDRQ